MPPAPCPRCGKRGRGGLCDRCLAYLLRFDPFLVRPGLPGPSVDAATRRGTALLTLNLDAPVRFAKTKPRKEDGAYAMQFLRHVGLPDGGRAILTRGDRDVLHRLLRAWARTPPEDEELGRVVSALYAEIAALPDLPAAAAAPFRSLAGIAEPVARARPAEAGPPVPTPVPRPGPEPAPEPEPTGPPVPPPPESVPSESRTEAWKPLSDLKGELVSKKEELLRWLEERQRDVDRRALGVESKIEEMRGREEAVAERERRIEEEARRREARADAQRRADEADPARRLYLQLFSFEGMSRAAAEAFVAAFPTEDRIRAASLDDLAAVSGVLPEQAAAVRDAFAEDGGPPQRDLREKAQELLEEQETEAALEVFDELVRVDPGDADAWYNRGEVLALLGRADDAVAAYEQVLRLDPEHRTALGELVSLLFEVGHYGQAAATLSDLLRRAPEQTDAWLVRASSLLEEGKRTEATLLYNAVLEGDPQNLVAGLALGDLLLAMGDVKRAEREYSRALQHHPSSPDALLKKGLLHNRQGRWGAAIQLFNRAISLRWNFPEAWAAKGQVLLTQGKAKDALECFDKLLTFDETREGGWLGKAEAHLALGENDKAAEAAGRALALNRDNAYVQRLLERLREATDRPSGEPVDVAAPPPEEETSDPGALLETAEGKLDAGDAEAALRGFDEVLSRDDRNGAAWFGKGRALHALDRYGEAVRCFAAARDLEPGNEEYVRWLAVCRDRVRKEAGG